MLFLSIWLSVNAGADEIIYRYQKMLLDEIKENSVNNKEVKDRAWRQAKELVAPYVSADNIKQPITLVVDKEYLDYQRRIKGIYEPDLNIVIATNFDVLVHEYIHTMLYAGGEQALSANESFIRQLWNFRD